MLKKVLYIHQYFKTPQEGGAIRSYYIAKGLVENGCEVNLITSHNESGYVKKTIEGIIVHYLPIYYDNTLGIWGRGLSFIRFTKEAIGLAKNLPKQDICYATSTPLTVGLIALRLKKKMGIPYFFEVRDLWPEAPIQMGVIKNPLLKRYLRWLELEIYKKADKIIALSPGIRDSIVKRVPNKQIFVIPNMADIDFFKLEKEISPIGAQKEFVICYFGAIGKANNLQSLIDIAECSKKHNLKINFQIAGIGAELSKIKKMVIRKKLQKSVEFIPYQNKTGIKKLLQTSDAAYVSFANKPVLTTNSPNKYFDALAAGKLMIVNTNGWLREITEENKCGFYIDPDNVGDFIQKIEPFLEHPSELQKFQKNSRKLAELYFSKDLQIQKIIKIFKNVQ